MSITTFEITIDADEKNKRAALLNSLDMALLASSTRVLSGTFEVTIKRLSKKELAAARAAEQAQNVHSDTDPYAGQELDEGW